MEYTKKLSTALKQSEQAHRNLRLVQQWARKYHHPHLEQGISDLIHRMGHLKADLRTLIEVVRSQGGANLGAAS
jgi:hypothetical protein